MTYAHSPVRRFARLDTHLDHPVLLRVVRGGSLQGLDAIGLPVSIPHVEDDSDIDVPLVRICSAGTTAAGLIIRNPFR